MNTLTYTSFRENLADALERAEKGETIEITRRGHQPVLLTPKNAPELKTVKFMSKDKFDASLKRVQKKHAKNIQALADR
jgi:prevent-host-death family protein